MKKIGIVVIVLALFIGGAMFFPVSKPHVQLPAEKIAEIGSFAITNTMAATWATMIVLSLLFLFATRNMQTVPGRFQSFAEMVVEALLGLIESVAGKEKARQFFPLLATFFLFILISNWMGLLPGYGTILIKEPTDPAAVVQNANSGTEHNIALVKADAEAKDAAPENTSATDAEGPEKVALFRSANTDLNTTLALALISVLVTQYFGVKAVGGRAYVSRFINLKGPIDFFVGLLETISEIAKIISFSFRLFGNIFAGEVLLGVMMFLVPWIASIPFMGLELFVGAIQAFVFFMLSLVFMTLATAEHGAEHAKAH